MATESRWAAGSRPTGCARRAAEGIYARTDCRAGWANAGNVSKAAAQISPARQNGFEWSFMKAASRF
jgi:hypothetical protein